MFEQSKGVEEPWYIDRAGFEETDQAVHIYVRAKETAKYACPECGKLWERGRSPIVVSKIMCGNFGVADTLTLPCLAA